MVDSIEQFLPVSTMGVAIATDGAVWLYHPPSPDGMVEILPPVTPTPPTNSAPPTITAIPNLQVGSQAVMNPGTWQNSPTFTRTWARGGTVIPGATASAYTFVAADVGLMISGALTGTNQDGSLTVPASNSVGPIIEPPLEEEPSAGSIRGRGAVAPKR